jgi:hypothetical protein
MYIPFRKPLFRPAFRRIAPNDRSDVNPGPCMFEPTFRFLSRVSSVSRVLSVYMNGQRAAKVST